MTNKQRWKLGIYGIIAGIVCALILYFGLPLFHLAHGVGAFEQHEERTYNANNEENLKALYTGMMNYYDTEDQFPPAAKWMDEIKSRVRIGDMEKAETAKKFVNPLVLAGPRAFGYAMNDLVSSKTKKQADPKAILIFDSSDTSWNAHGDPKKMGSQKYGGEGITVDGRIVKL